MIDLPPSEEIALEMRTRVRDRLSSPSAGRNKGFIASALSAILPQGARVLEVASGTGEHALACVLARPDLAWTPSERNPDSRRSIDSWAVEAGQQITPCLDLDVMETDWAARLGPFDAVFCANMIHIAPWGAAEGLFRGSAELLSASGTLHLYGPFQEGAATAASNLTFDMDLRRRDPSWGVRALSAVDELANANGFTRTDRLEMPANNLLVTWERSR